MEKQLSNNKVSLKNYLMHLFLYLKIFILICIDLLLGQTGGLPYPFQNYVNIERQRLEHFQKTPMFKLRKYKFDFLTDIPKDSISNASIFFRTDSMKNFREISLANSNGLYRFEYDPHQFPGFKIEYFFVVKMKLGEIHAFPLNSKGELTTAKHIFIDATEYYKRNSLKKQ
tara:strand:- start:82 stop:594 length:513 start_codon:yes stop_codon:yes gene_type:complete